MERMTLSWKKFFSPVYILFQKSVGMALPCSIFKIIADDPGVTRRKDL